MRPDESLIKRLFEYAKDCNRHDRSPTYKIIAAWIGRNRSIISARANYLVDGHVYGMHAEQNCMKAVLSDTLVVVRFNAPSLSQDLVQPRMARPCPACTRATASVPDIWYTDINGNWQYYTVEERINVASALSKQSVGRRPCDGRVVPIAQYLQLQARVG